MFDVRKQEKRIVLIFIFSIFIYSFFILSADIKQMRSISATFNWSIVPLLLFLSYANYIFRFFRWKFLLKKINVHLKTWTSFNIFFSGISMTVTPGKMGEVLKAYLVKKETGNKFGEMVPLLVFERFTDGCAMIIMALGGVYILKQSILFFLFATGLIALFILFIYAKDPIIKIIEAFEKRFFHLKLLDFAIAFFNNSQKLLTPKTLGVSLFLAVIAWMVEGAALFLLINEFTSDFTLRAFMISMFIFSFSSIAGFLVFIPGGIGVTEGAISSMAMLFFGIPFAQAIFIALIFRFITLWFGVALGSLYLVKTIKKTTLR